MIQQSINQLINTAGLAARLSPGYEKRQEAESILGKAKSSAAGLTAIEKGLKEKNKNLSETQLKDIKSRTSELNRNIYDAKIRAKAGDPLESYLSKGIKDLPDQKKLYKTLGNIESNIASREEMMKEKAMENMRNKGQSAVDQDRIFSALRNAITSGFSQYGGDSLSYVDELGYVNIPFDTKKKITTDTLKKDKERLDAFLKTDYTKLSEDEIYEYQKEADEFSKIFKDDIRLATGKNAYIRHWYANQFNKDKNKNAPISSYNLDDTEALNSIFGEDNNGKE